MAITAARPSSSSGSISGDGFAIAKATGSLAIERIPRSDTAPGALRPMKTSVPTSTSSAEPWTRRGFVVRA